MMRLLLLAALLAMSACAPVSPYGPLYGAQVAAPAPGQLAFGSFCAAGAYQCQLPQGGPVGSPCACPGIGAPSYGVIR